MRHKTTLIILSRNEVNGLTSLIRRIPVDQVDECFTVDFSSTDGTVELLKKHGIQVHHQHKPGRSEAFRIGAKHATGDILIFFSPDGNENPTDIPRLIKEIRQGADIAIASRFLPFSRNEEDDEVFKWRKWANQAFTWLANTFFRTTGAYVTDSINGYRAIKKTAFNRLNLDADGFAIEYQMTIRAMKQRLIIREIPTREGNRIGGQSGSLAIPTGIVFVGYFLRELARK